MKKLFILAIMAASTASFAQGIVGPKVGLNINNFQNTNTNVDPVTGEKEEADGFSTSVTPTLGVVFNAQIGEYFALRPEILWVQRGSKLMIDINNTSEKIKIVTNYVEIPFNLVGRIPAGPGKVEIFAGPAVGYNLGGKYKSSTPLIEAGKVKGADEPASGGEKNTLYMNYLNVSLNFGVGYNWNGLVFQAGYNLGLSNLTAHPEVRDDQKLVDERNNDVLKASAVTFGVAYLFGNKD
jgi:hypothetical protein